MNAAACQTTLVIVIFFCFFSLNFFIYSQSHSVLKHRPLNRTTLTQTLPPRPHTPTDRRFCEKCFLVSTAPPPPPNEAPTHSHGHGKCQQENSSSFRKRTGDEKIPRIFPSHLATNTDEFYGKYVESKRENVRKLSIQWNCRWLAMIHHPEPKKNPNTPRPTDDTVVASK